MSTDVAPRAWLGLRELGVDEMLPSPEVTEAVPLTEEEQTALDEAELHALIVWEAMQYEETAWADMQSDSEDGQCLVVGRAWPAGCCHDGDEAASLETATTDG